jgi:transcriptional regulator with XRE-family HTH domain
VDREALLERIGDRLTQLRIARGLDLRAAAFAAAVDEERLAAAEDGGTELGGDELDRLAGAYGVDAAEIFGGRTTPLQNYAGA